MIRTRCKQRLLSWFNTILKGLGLAARSFVGIPTRHWNASPHGAFTGHDGKMSPFLSQLTIALSSRRSEGRIVDDAASSVWLYSSVFSGVREFQGFCLLAAERALVGVSDDFLRGFVLACEYEAGDATKTICEEAAVGSMETVWLHVSASWVRSPVRRCEIVPWHTLKH